MSTSEHEAAAEILRQADQRNLALTNGDGPWTIVSDHWSESDKRSGGRFVAFSDPSIREDILNRASWDLTKGGGQPGFSQHSENGTWVTSYERNTAGPSIEPLIIFQDHWGVVPDSVHVAQDFVLLMNLWRDPATGNYFEIKDDGSKDLVIEFSAKQIRVRTPLLRRYQAARQLDLLLFTDSVVYAETTEGEGAFADLNEDDHAEGAFGFVAFNVGGSHWSTKKQVLSRLLAKRVLPPPPQEMSGIWPWDHVDERFPKFIIGEDANGQPVRFTCNPDQLANYFGKNDDAPHYLTPVFFRADVLQKYYNDDLYSVVDGHLQCAGLWSCHIDNVDADHVMVFLGDLGRDLPECERAHWLSHNIAPAGRRMSEANFRRSFLGQFADTENPEHRFKNAYQDFKRKWQSNWGWDLYREPNGPDARIIQRLRIPLNETDAEFESQLLALAKVLVDLLNEAKLVEGLEAVPNEKGLAKLRRFLESHSYAEIDRDIALLRKIQGLRSKIAAHTSGQSGQSILSQQMGSLSKPDFVKQLMTEATQMLTSLGALVPQEDK